MNDTAILVTFLNGFSGGSISVQSVNTCGASSLRSLAIQTNIPSRPGLINGSTNVCENVAPDGTARTFSVAPVAGATAYTWTAPAGSVVTHPNGSGANDFIITVLFPSGFGNGIITVAAGNGCATSATRSLSVNTLQPAAPGGITSTANSHSVQWTIPLGGVILNGQGTASVTVSYTSTAVSGSVTAAGVSTCGSSGIRAASVELADCDAPPPPPPPPFARNFTDNLQQPEDKMMLKISPNPSVNDFKLQVVSPDKEIINIRILDLSGIELRKMIVAPNGIVRFGSELKAGTYILQTKQGNHKMTGKLIRL
ncbi:MAG: T9SS type A sorting domain-containing protein [Ferruginibacter sp.]|nr:T9SS type A sorting domain-containing protein [Ferruginibacter sp.]